MKKIYDSFQNCYSLSKVLRFSLIPVGKTKSYIENSGILSEDEQRAEHYKIVKKLMDQYHKDFINRVLADINLEGLDEYNELYNTKERSEKEDQQFEELKSSLRKQIVNYMKKDPQYKGLFSADIIKKYLPEYLSESNDLKAVEDFSNFTTYFTGFYQNRENMYTDEDISTSISHRLITQNLPKFLDNVNIYKKIADGQLLVKERTAVEKDLQQYIYDKKLECVFTPDYYNHVLTNKQIQEYNTLLGGYVDEKQKNIQGLNEYINLYNQKLKKGEHKIPTLKPLYKQILADREDISFVVEKFDADSEVLEAVQMFYEKLHEEILPVDDKDSENIRDFFSDIEGYSEAGIYIKNDQSISFVSQQMYGQWSVIRDALNALYDSTYSGKKKSAEKYEEERNKIFKRKKGFSFAEINNGLKLLSEEYAPIQTYFKNMGKDNNLIDALEKSYQKIENLLIMPYPSDKQLKSDEQNIELLKELLDSMIAIQHFLKLFTPEETDKDEVFYSVWDSYCSIFDPVVQIYNKVRNYVTGKPYSVEKVKLNFQNPTLLNGWDKNKERDNTGVILQKNGKYYLGIMQKKSNTLFLDENIPNCVGKEGYKKMNYKLLPGPNKMFPKVFFSKSRIDEFNPSQKILEIRDKESFKKGNAFNIEDCHEFVDFFKQSIEKHKDWNKFNFDFSDTKNYKDISDFYREVEQQNYMITFTDIPEDYIDDAVEKGQLFLFQIYNKDFSKYSHGKKNLHTLYWEMLFNEKNLKDVVYKLNGEAEVFYRKASIPQHITHPANTPLNKKNPNNSGESIFPYDLIKDKRYTVDKFLFHVPVTLNYKARGYENINEEVNLKIAETEGMCAIGIDRGERNLLYISVVDANGRIIHQESLNVIGEEKKFEQDYHRLLDEREKERDESRKAWKSIAGIKELKEGYLSLVIHKIAQLMIQYQAIVVLEDLNFGFMRGRQKVEKQVYQKFEHMLIDKLNYLVDKGQNEDEPGGLLHAYQLTSKFISFNKLGKQSGFLYYVPAWNTSKMDPTTGFVNLLYPKYTSVEEARNYLDRFDSIKYNKTEKYFEISFDYINFTEKADGTKTKWTICTKGERIETFRNPAKNSEWDTRNTDLTELFSELLSKYNIEFKTGLDIKDEIVKSDKKDASFYKGVMHLLQLTLQMRNSIPNTDIDYLISPVKNAAGEFFCTKNAPNYLPEDADANGAFNIARKGLWAIDVIKKTDINKMKKINFAISNKEWLQYAQSHTLV